MILNCVNGRCAVESFYDIPKNDEPGTYSDGANCPACGCTGEPDCSI